MDIIINIEPLSPVMNDLAIKLAMVLFIPLFLALIVKVILMNFMKESIAGRIASLSLLFFMYYVFIFVTGVKRQ
ncbi:hypothetical protein SIL80_24600 [Bacillus cereus group sp. BfR-BA-01119]|uniref:hypothetical protein n=1 Tax=Bacillus cereus group TaxID=86661 RepID=UPI00016B72E6|nr:MULTISPECIES: hypothetical protein [Bacillus cereus group]MDG0912485.1 hypothetical protein [Bacillus paranthracis]MDR4351280.1 hypothetical protein [Bacillus paranthracis]MDX5869004.1 hypothetical protein [Bacillus cereus group sp. BfR-BA-01119]MDX5874757.1 hypothetical protein [Bacillus cereus group sp. BfR-BA-01344]MDX5885765.1 hypothetical protein [Bacillus cereus group sp. BfR-BA-00999]